MIAAGVLVAFLFLSIETYLATYTLGEFHLNFGLFGPTLAATIDNMRRFKDEVMAKVH